MGFQNTFSLRKIKTKIICYTLIIPLILKSFFYLPFACSIKFFLLTLFFSRHICFFPFHPTLPPLLNPHYSTPSHKHIFSPIKTNKRDIFTRTRTHTHTFPTLSCFRCYSFFYKWHHIIDFLASNIMELRWQDKYIGLVMKFDDNHNVLNDYIDWIGYLTSAIRKRQLRIKLLLPSHKVWSLQQIDHKKRS